MSADARQAFREFDEPVENRTGEVIGFDPKDGEPLFLIDTSGMPPPPWRTHFGDHREALGVINDAYRLCWSDQQQLAVDTMNAAIAAFEAANTDELAEAELHRQANDLDEPRRDDVATGIDDNFWPVEAALTQLVWHRNFMGMTDRERYEFMQATLNNP